MKSWNLIGQVPANQCQIYEPTTSNHQG